MSHDKANADVRDPDLCTLIYWSEKIMKEMHAYTL